MKFAWIENDIIRDIAPGNPEEFYHPDIAAHYNTKVPDDAENGDTFKDGVLTKKPVDPAPVEPAPTEPTDPVDPVV